MIEYGDLSFSEPLNAFEAIDRFKDEFNAGIDVRALYIGNISELEDIKRQKNIEKRIAEIEKRLDSIEPTTSNIIELPTKEQTKLMELFKNDSTHKNTHL